MRRAVAAGSAGGTMLIVLAILYWLFFYQNLPGTLDGMAMASQGAMPTAPDSNTFDRFVKICILSISVYVIVNRWVVARKLAAFINPGAAAFMLLAPLSALWSIEPTATLLRFVSLLCIVLLCFAISVTGWHRQRFEQLAIPPLMFILIGSLIAGLIFPERITEIGTDVSQRGAWHGITHSKNEFGMMSSLATIICFNRVLAAGRRVIWAMLGSAIAVACLVLSRSNTSLIATVIGVVTMFLVMRVPVIKRRFSAHVVVSIAVMILFYELVIQDILPGTHTLLGPITSMLGKDTTFSARTVIWNVVKEHMQGAPYLGTGYGAYWLGPFPWSPSYVFVPMMYFYPTEAHNGYLDVMNDLGFLGLSVLVLFLFWYVRQTVQLMRVDRSQGALYAGVLLQEMVINMSESDWFSRTSTFAVLGLAIFCLSRALLESRQRGS